MSKSSDGKRIAILATDGVEQAELVEPRRARDESGATTTLISPARDRLQAFKHHDQGDKFKVDIQLRVANPADYDALLLPGGVANPDTLRTMPDAVMFVKSFGAEGKPIAAICHGPWMLVEADLVRGHSLTAWPSLKTDVRNAGGKWIDREVVQDGKLTTSRKPDDIPGFVREMLKSFAENGAAPAEKPSGLGHYATDR
jgi:protease I